MIATRQNVALRNATPQGRPPWAPDPSTPISRSSAGVTPAFSAGESRNHANQTAAHTTPRMPKSQKEARQP